MIVYLGSNELKKAYIWSQEIKQIRVGSNKVFPASYTPTSNTLAYFPFKNDILDHSGNWATPNNTQYFTKATIWYNRKLSQWSTWLWIGTDFVSSSAKFMSMWYKINYSSGNARVLNMAKYWSVSYNTSHWRSDLTNKIAIFTNSSWTIWASMNWKSFNARHHLAIWYYDSNWVKVFWDWVKTNFYSWSGYNFWDSVWICWIWNNGNVSFDIWETIVEKSWRTDQFLTDYYNNTKGDYWIT